MKNDLALVPAMDIEGLDFFKKSIALSNCFLEYGCGGSTSYAANSAKVKNIISVDTSKEWVENVYGSLSSAESNLMLEFCDLGPIREWGTPINRDKSADFWRYMVTPWSVARSNNIIPDTILIDGRFRVASFLYSLVSARVGTLIMFDDYFGRPNYFIVEKFCRLHEKHGRMGVFFVEHSYAVADIVATIAEYSTDWS